MRFHNVFFLMILGSIVIDCYIVVNLLCACCEIPVGFLWCRCSGIPMVSKVVAVVCSFCPQCLQQSFVAGESRP